MFASRSSNDDDAASELSLRLTTPDNELVRLKLTRSYSIPHNPTTVIGRDGKMTYWKAPEGNVSFNYNGVTLKSLRYITLYEDSPATGLDAIWRLCRTSLTTVAYVLNLGEFVLYLSSLRLFVPTIYQPSRSICRKIERDKYQ